MRNGVVSFTFYKIIVYAWRYRIALYHIKIDLQLSLFIYVHILGCIVQCDVGKIKRNEKKILFNMFNNYLEFFLKMV